MDRELLAAALRVLTHSIDGRCLAQEDVDLLRSRAVFQERDYDLEDLSSSIIQRIMAERRREKVC